ncbi:MAG: flagellar basal body rod protein FlgB [Azonexus sp.]|nr:flagellar basal body rod protein FlgB [Azonexus sp.]
MADFKSHFGVLSKALDLRAERQQVLASNIANADTPHYKARDFDFRAAMNAAVAGRAANGNLSLQTTHAGHQQGDGLNAAVKLQYRGEYQSAVDGNTVDMDTERAQIADNSVQYQILTQLIADKFQGLRTAMSSSQG